MCVLVKLYNTYWIGEQGLLIDADRHGLGDELALLRELAQDLDHLAHPLRDAVDVFSNSLVQDENLHSTYWARLILALQCYVLPDSACHDNPQFTTR